ncbi:MAG: DUF6384 family protein [Hyphomicrobiaceae bacterium]
MADSEAKTDRPLDDVMIAMDVVDTLRHDKRIVERELDDDARRKDLIEQLRTIYKSQGIDVPDHILEEGVKALDEQRFQYKPAPDSLQVKLARLYVTRGKWGRKVIGAGVAMGLVSGGWYLGVERPKAVERAAFERELKTDIPRRLKTLSDEIAKITRKPSITADAQKIADSANAAATAGNRDAARAGVRQLEATVRELRRAYDIRIINRRGEVTGLWRVPRVNPSSRNYYLVVEAVDRKGTVLPRDVMNEETGKRETVMKWAVRVPKSVFDEIQADKLDDGIIQKAIMGTKELGELEPTWRLPVSGGELTKW